MARRMTWEPDLKNYPHFDAAISLKEIEALVRHPARVAANTFYPFMRYEQRWQPFRQRKNDAGVAERPEKKTRPIRFASRRDAYILSYYRHLLSELYEVALSASGLSASVIAYRKLKDANGRGKSNIEFAADAFDVVRSIGTCAVIALDISSFFETLDHDLLREKWCRVLGAKKLPADHEAVFRAMTRYAVVDREAVYERLGFMKRVTKGGKERLVYTRPFKKMPRKLCTNSEFRAKICGGDPTLPSLIRLNRKPYGIPQGAPISDLLANIYMLDFDRTMLDYCQSRGGTYFRYSDDILMILPGGQHEANAARAFAVGEITNHGAHLKIKDAKTAVGLFHQPPGSASLSYEHLSGRQGRNGVEYLGFRFDGERVFIRDSTISKLYRKVAVGVKAEVTALLKRYVGATSDQIKNSFNYSTFFQRYGRVDDFSTDSSYDEWTFWSYARRAFTRFGIAGSPIPRQLRRFKLIVRRRVEREIDRRFESS